MTKQKSVETVSLREQFIASTELQEITFCVYTHALDAFSALTLLVGWQDGL